MIDGFFLSTFKAIKIAGEYIIKFDWMDPIMLMGKLTIPDQIRRTLYIMNTLIFYKTQGQIKNLK